MRRGGRGAPCAFLPAVAGDLRTQSFAEIWRASPLFRRLGEGVLGGKCGACEYRGLCGGCRARAYALAGDVLAADPSCTYEPPPGAAGIAPPRAVTSGAQFRPGLPSRPAPRVPGAPLPSFLR